jgi:two-component system, LytTR family, response regulator
MITATIVDDEPDCCESLVMLLELYCPTVKVIDICYSAADALISLQRSPPQLLFLDIEMPHLNGFELLEKIPELNFKLVFTTSYDQYAIKAIRFSALDYLLKPVNREELQSAVKKAIQSVNIPYPQQIELLFQKINHPTVLVNKIAIPTMDGYRMVSINAIVYCKADSNYTILFLKDRQKLTTTRTLKEIEEFLNEYGFLRIHNSYIVNLNEIEHYTKGEGGSVRMSDGSIIDVSRSRKEVLLSKLKPGKI